ncbi:hypothetical protein N7509_000206 [Penicillium cosmopolitanum]|uniref:Uncharacterized protein n=1 Tax=Penicillium cosmopolitanum TaxID=1131564 RepID=A0A9X0BF39_9EURO|nr:uncharacterized protein N7509_000206 [Penicillium cosmopolitanum]KAJ5414872.1 hypothetical protein N7509_000206 [Penicillium cosmopolitanum]
MPSDKATQLAYLDSHESQHHRVYGRKDWIEAALARIGYDFNMLQLERNNMTSILQLFERDKVDLEDCIQHMKDAARQRNERLSHQIEDLEVRFAVREYK